MSEITNSNHNIKLGRDELALAFLRRTLPPEGSGCYCLWKKSNAGRAENIFADTIDDLWQRIREYDRGGRGNVYFALATFKDNSSRKAANAVALKAFIADIDVDIAKAAKGIGYASPKEAAAALKLFCIATDLPWPMVVQSGHGLHVYWPLTEPLPAAEWKPLAEKMKRLFVAQGLRADPAVTADAAGVLRVPGTANRKAGMTAVEVTMHPAFLNVGPYELEKFLIVSDRSNVLPFGKGELGPTPPYLKAVAGRNPPDAVKAPAEPFPVSDAEPIADVCAQIRHMRDTRGLMTEPEWHCAIGVIARCNGGDKFCHNWSKGDPRYTHDETQTKIDRTLKETTGPTKCETFSGLGNGRCESCPLLGKITSPIELGRRPSDPSVPLAPAGLKWVLTQGGHIKEKNYPNAMTAIAALKIECRHDVFHDRKLVAGDVTDNLGPELSDTIARAVRERIIAQFDFDPGKDNIQEALEWACERIRFDPMVDYFDAVKWDGQPRVDRWLTNYLGAEDTPLNRAFGRKTLLAGVRRVRQPGCKFDFMLVLEGPQGSGKSTALRVLAGGDENFSDQTIRLQDPQMQQEAVSGVFIYEIAELESIRKAEVETVKTFLSRTSDNVRPAYGRFRVDRPRRCIFIGTTNAGKHDGYLQDPSGNRRFWPVECRAIDLAALRRDRDQLWAEAAEIEATSEALAIGEELYEAATVQQGARRIQDGWLEILEDVRGECVETPEGPIERIASKTLLTMHLDLTGAQIRDFHTKRLGRVMRVLGWQGPGPMRVTSRLGDREEGGLVRGYWRKAEA